MSVHLLGVIVDGALSLAVIIAATLLLALGKVTTPVGLTMFGVAIAFASGSAQTALALLVPPPVGRRRTDPEQQQRSA